MTPELAALRSASPALVRWPGSQQPSALRPLPPETVIAAMALRDSLMATDRADPMLAQVADHAAMITILAHALVTLEPPYALTHTTTMIAEALRPGQLAHLFDQWCTVQHAPMPDVYRQVLAAVAQGDELVTLDALQASLVDAATFYGTSHLTAGQLLYYTACRRAYQTVTDEGPGTRYISREMLGS